MSDYIRVKRSKIHGSGVFARKNIPEGTRIIEYKGKKLSKKTADKILEEVGASAAVYIFEINDKYDIDGDVSWNDARYINHSCVPNCESENADNKIWIIATRDIKKGEELTYDYHFARADWHERPCLCSATKCFGFIVSREYRRPISKTKRYQKLMARER